MSSRFVIRKGLIVSEGGAQVTGSLSLSCSIVSNSSTHIFSGSIRSRVVTLPVVSSTASLNLGLGNFFSLTLPSSSKTFLNVTNILPGQTANIRIIQPAVSGSLSYGTQFKFPGGISYVVSSTGSAEDILTVIAFDRSKVYATFLKNIR